MYLDHKVDPEILKQAAAEIGQSPEFARLQTEMNSKVQVQLAHARKEPSASDLAALYGKDLNHVQHRKGIAFRYTLNAVIGGVSGVKVESAQILSRGVRAGQMALDYRVNVNFADTYDFENKRTGAYEAYRQKLAYLLSINDFTRFEDAYDNEAMPWGSPKTHLDGAAVFASFMYALERKGWTPGPLPWNVSVPMMGTVTLSPQH
jgi:hypothetical protein